MLKEEEVKKRGVYIQGDVVLFPTSERAVGKEKPGGVLAEGEVTGHAHRVNTQRAVVLVANLPATLWLKSLGADPDERIEVKHEEHESLKLPNQDYLSWGQQEYSWAEGLRRVAD